MSKRAGTCSMKTGHCCWQAPQVTQSQIGLKPTASISVRSPFAAAWPLPLASSSAAGSRRASQTKSGPVILWTWNSMAERMSCMIFFGESSLPVR